MNESEKNGIIESDSTKHLRKKKKETKQCKNSYIEAHYSIAARQ